MVVKNLTTAMSPTRRIRAVLEHLGMRLVRFSRLRKFMPRQHCLNPNLPIIDLIIKTLTSTPTPNTPRMNISSLRKESSYQIL